MRNEILTDESIFENNEQELLEDYNQAQREFGDLAFTESGYQFELRFGEFS